MQARYNYKLHYYIYFSFGTVSQLFFSKGEEAWERISSIRPSIKVNLINVRHKLTFWVINPFEVMRHLSTPNKVHTKDTNTTNTHTYTRTHTLAHTHNHCSLSRAQPPVSHVQHVALASLALAMALTWFGCHRLSPYLNYWLAPKPGEATPSGANYSVQIRAGKKGDAWRNHV